MRWEDEIIKAQEITYDQEKQQREACGSSKVGKTENNSPIHHAKGGPSKARLLLLGEDLVE